jgi:hypothetical protein
MAISIYLKCIQHHRHRSSRRVLNQPSPISVLGLRPEKGLNANGGRSSKGLELPERSGPVSVRGPLASSGVIWPRCPSIALHSGDVGTGTRRAARLTEPRGLSV